jgi:hypothetical protein
MVSKKHYKRKSSSSKNCKGGRKSSKRTRTEKKRKTHKWYQKGCQSGGSSLVGGGSAWKASDVQHQSGGSGGSGSESNVGAVNGNHYALNTSISAPAQSSNHLVEKGMFGGRHTRRHGRKGNKRGRKHRHFIGEQRGGMADYLPEIANAEVRGIAEVPSSMVNAIQGSSTAFKTSNPTIQPIGQPIQLA